MELFSFPYLYPSYYHSVIYRVTIIVSDGRNQSSFVFFYVVFESLYRCVNDVFDAISLFINASLFYFLKLILEKKIFPQIT